MIILRLIYFSLLLCFCIATPMFRFSPDQQNDFTNPMVLDTIKVIPMQASAGCMI